MSLIERKLDPIQQVYRVGETLQKGCIQQKVRSYKYRQITKKY